MASVSHPAGLYHDAVSAGSMDHFPPLEPVQQYDDNEEE